jgi:hypothetical protein
MESSTGPARLRRTGPDRGLVPGRGEEQPPSLPLVKRQVAGPAQDVQLEVGRLDLVSAEDALTSDRVEGEIRGSRTQIDDVCARDFEQVFNGGSELDDVADVETLVAGRKNSEVKIRFRVFWDRFVAVEATIDFACPTPECERRDEPVRATHG